MRRLPDLALPQEAADKLEAWQAEVDARPSFAERVADAKRLFSSRNKKGNSTFDTVKQSLSAMCAGARRCAYCEDSAADEVEHVWPKHFYPDRVFRWLNYVYACGPCNGPKGSRFAVFPAGPGSRFDLTETNESPPSGVAGVIDPRTEDVESFFGLDLRDTFWFVPRHPKGTLDHERAELTIDVLGLNARDLLPKARRSAYKDFKAHLIQYREVRHRHDDPVELERLADEIRGRQHPTVWHEMKRQHARLPDLAPLFAEVPEALSW